MPGCFSDNILTVCHLNTFGSDQRFIAHSNYLFCEKDSGLPVRGQGCTGSNLFIKRNTGKFKNQ